MTRGIWMMILFTGWSWTNTADAKYLETTANWRMILFRGCSCTNRIILRLREASRVCHARILDIQIIRNILGEGNTISDYMSTIYDSNYIDVKIPDRDAWAGGEPPLEALAIYTDQGSKMAEGTSAGVFCPNPFIKYSYTLNDNCNVFLMLRYLIEMHGLVENLLWKLWKFTQTKVSKMDEGTGDNVFCPNPLFQRSHKLNENCSVFGRYSCNQEGRRAGKRTMKSHNSTRHYMCRYSGAL